MIRSHPFALLAILAGLATPAAATTFAISYTGGGSFSMHGSSSQTTDAGTGLLTLAPGTAQAGLADVTDFTFTISGTSTFSSASGTTTTPIQPFTYTLADLTAFAATQTADGLTDVFFTLHHSGSFDPFGGFADNDGFGDENPGSGGFLHVGGTVTISAVPEPAPWAMMIGGFGLVGGAMRRHRTGIRCC